MIFNEAAHKSMCAYMQHAGLTIPQIAKRYKISKRTVYRWIEYAKEQGYTITRRGTGPQTRYYIGD